MSRIRVAVIRGGLSDEYQVSLWTGASVLEHLDRNLFDPVDVIIAKTGEWIVDGRVRLPENILHSVDVVFNALHGKYGEDGTIQRLFERYGVPYTGSKPYPSGIAMNKVLTKNYLKDTDIKVPQHVHVTKDSIHDISRISEQIVDMYGPQYIIKPVSGGSSVGTMMVKNPLLLPQALKDSLSVVDEVMVEARIPGREATCGVVDKYRGDTLYALPPVEIVPSAEEGFFTERAKYNGLAQEYCPARFSHTIKDDIEHIAKIVHKRLGLSQYSRSDFIIAEDGIYFLEVNALPGLTNESLLPRALKAVGGSYTDFITHILRDALSQSRRAW